jgi:hypothetical protein
MAGNNIVEFVLKMRENVKAQTDKVGIDRQSTFGQRGGFDSRRRKIGKEL